MNICTLHMRHPCVAVYPLDAKILHKSYLYLMGNLKNSSCIFSYLTQLRMLGFGSYGLVLVAALWVFGRGKHNREPMHVPQVLNTVCVMCLQCYLPAICRRNGAWPREDVLPEKGFCQLFPHQSWKVPLSFSWALEICANGTAELKRLS